MSTYAERMRIGTQRAIEAGVDPRVAPFRASEFAPDESQVMSMPQQPRTPVATPADVFQKVAAARAAAHAATHPDQADMPRILAGAQDLGNSIANVFDKTAALSAGGSPLQVALPFAQQVLGPEISKAVGSATRSANKDAAIRGQEMVQRSEFKSPADVWSAVGGARPGARNQPSGLKINSYTDPRWDAMEAQAAKEVGMPGLAQLLGAIRTRGERSNNDQTNSHGTHSVYQIIPATAAGLKKNYGVDVYAGPEQATLGAALLMKENLQRTGGDPRKAVQAYVGGWGPAGPAAQAERNAYLGRVFGDEGMQGWTAGNPFDPKYTNMALGEVNKAEAVALQPQSVTVDRGPRPELPDLVKPEKTDWTLADAALQDMRPDEMMEAEKSGIRRQGFWQGLGEALMRTPDGVGLGQLLAQVGGGALAGRMGAESEIRARMDKFDARMAQWKSAVFQQEGLKAQVAQREAAAEAAAINQHGMLKWQDAMKQFDELGATVTSQGIVTKIRNKDGSETTTLTPNRGAVMSAMALQRAAIMQGASGQFNSGASLDAQAQNGILGAMAGAQIKTQMTRDAAGISVGQGGIDALQLSTAVAAQSIVANGGLPGLVGADQYKALQKEAQKYAISVSTPGSSGYDEALNSYLTQQLMQAVMGSRDEGFRGRFAQAAGLGAAQDAATRMRGRKERTSAGANGYSVSMETTQ